jgi:hypothetical protein
MNLEARKFAGQNNKRALGRSIRVNESEYQRAKQNVVNLVCQSAVCQCPGHFKAVKDVGLTEGVQS